MGKSLPFERQFLRVMIAVFQDQDISTQDKLPCIWKGYTRPEGKGCRKGKCWLNVSCEDCSIFLVGKLVRVLYGTKDNHFDATSVLRKERLSTSGKGKREKALNTLLCRGCGNVVPNYISDEWRFRRSEG